MRRLADSVLAVSEGVAAEVRTLGVRAERVLVVGNGVDTRTSSRRTASVAVRGRPVAGLRRDDVRDPRRGRLRAGVRAASPTIPRPRLSMLGQGTDRVALQGMAERRARVGWTSPGSWPPAEVARRLRGARPRWSRSVPAAGTTWRSPPRCSRRPAAARRWSTPAGARAMTSSPARHWAGRLRLGRRGGGRAARGARRRGPARRRAPRALDGRERVAGRGAAQAVAARSQERIPLPLQRAGQQRPRGPHGRSAACPSP